MQQMQVFLSHSTEAHYTTIDAVADNMWKQDSLLENSWFTDSGAHAAFICISMICFVLSKSRFS